MKSGGCLQPRRSVTISIIWNEPRYLAPPDVNLEPIEHDEDLEEEEAWLENPVMGAEELLRFSRVRELLQV